MVEPISAGRKRHAFHNGPSRNPGSAVIGARYRARPGAGHRSERYRPRMAADDDGDALYGLELSEFTPARTELVTRLKAEGERERAAEVGKLRKPTVAAWVVNRTARDAPDEMAALLDEGSALREVQLGGGSAADVRAATEAEQEALRTVMAAAGKVAKAADAGGDTLQRVHDTLHAAALDPELGELVRRGVLVREQQSAGGFLLGGLAPAPARPAAKAARSKAAAKPKGRAKPEPKEPQPTPAAVKRLERAQAAAGAAQEMLTDAEQEAGAAEDELTQAEAALAEARTALGAAERQVERAERQVARTRTNADRAGERAAKAQAALDALA